MNKKNGKKPTFYSDSKIIYLLTDNVFDSYIVYVLDIS